MNTVFSLRQKKFDRESTDSLDDLDVNAGFWGIFLNTTLQAAVLIIVKTMRRNSRLIKNHLWKSVRKLFEETEKLIKNQIEISGLTTIDYKEHTWSATSLLCDKANQITNAKTWVFAGSVLCLGSIIDEPIEAWEEQNLNGIWWKIIWKIWIASMESRRSSSGKYAQDSQRWASSKEIQKWMEDLRCEPEQFNDRIILMSMDNDIVWREKANTERCDQNSLAVANCARRFPRGRWSILGTWVRKEMVRSLLW